MSDDKAVTIIGGGLAGCEAAWKLGKAGIAVRLFEMRPSSMTPAHKTGLLAELVCSNSLKSDSLDNASGVLKAEMEALDSIVMKAARASRVPAGGALAVDRERFGGHITDSLESLEAVKIEREEIKSIPGGVVVVASGPLTSDALAEAISNLTGAGSLAFYDAIAPIVTAESVDMSVAFRASRYGKGGDDYINCPMDRREYEGFITALIEARRTPLREFEDPRYFEGCLPVETMAERGVDTLAHGPLKPVGLTDPRTGLRPHAVVQLRQDDAAGGLYNMVGFQTRLAWPEQERVFRMIPGLERAEFARLGSVHRNSYINSPKLLSADLSLRELPRVFFAGQITGVEGYLESAASGMMAGLGVIRRLQGKAPKLPPRTTVMGALMAYVTDRSIINFQPMNANFGVLEPLSERLRKKDRKERMARRALDEIKRFRDEIETD